MQKKSIATIFLVSDVKLLVLFWHLRPFSIICCESSNNEWSGIIRFHLITYLSVHYALLKYFRYFIREYANIYYSTLMYIRITNMLFFNSSSRSYFSLWQLYHITGYSCYELPTRKILIVYLAFTHCRFWYLSFHFISFLFSVVCLFLFSWLTQQMNISWTYIYVGNKTKGDAM